MEAFPDDDSASKKMVEAMLAFLTRRRPPGSVYDVRTFSHWHSTHEGRRSHHAAAKGSCRLDARRFQCALAGGAGAEFCADRLSDEQYRAFHLNWPDDQVAAIRHHLFASERVMFGDVFSPK